MDLTYELYSLTEETQRYLKKAMDIYSAIEEKDINGSGREWTLNDKKVISLFIAGFLVDGDLKNIVSQYEIKIKDLLNFVQLEETDIVPLENEEYEDYYESRFKFNLMGLISKGVPTEYEINFLSPELIFYTLRDFLYTGSHVLEWLSNKYKYSINLSDSAMVEVLKVYLINSDCITKKLRGGLFDYSFLNHSHFRKTDKNKDDEEPKDNNDKQIDEKPKDNNDKQKDEEKKDSDEKNDNRNLIVDDFLKTEEKTEAEKELKPKKFVIDDNVWGILDVIKSKFIGQEGLAEDLFFNMINNQSLINNGDINDGERSLIFLDGPSGTGKTAIIKEIADKIGIPFVITPMGKFSATGYVGGSLEDIIKNLYEKAHGDLEMAERGIVALDEIDKLIFGGNNALVMKKAVQHDLLDFLGGGKYKVTVGNSLFFMKHIEFDTSKLTFVCLGALTDLRKEKTTVKTPMGFGGPATPVTNQNYSITPADLIKLGFEKELIGRINVFLHTNDYDVVALERILRESAISPVLGFKKWVESQGKNLEIMDDTYYAIAKCSYELDTGARSLQTVMNTVRNQFLKEVLRGNSDTIYLDAEAVYEAYGHTTNRKARG